MQVTRYLELRLKNDRCSVFSLFYFSQSLLVKKTAIRCKKTYGEIGDGTLSSKFVQDSLYSDTYFFSRLYFLPENVKYLLMSELVYSERNSRKLLT